MSDANPNYKTMIVLELGTKFYSFKDLLEMSDEAFEKISSEFDQYITTNYPKNMIERVNTFENISLERRVRKLENIQKREK